MFDSGAISPSDTIQYIYQQSEEIKWIDFLVDRGVYNVTLKLVKTNCFNATVIYIIDYLFNFWINYIKV